MRRDWKQYLLGDWSVIDWLYVLAGTCCLILVLACVVLALPES